MTPENGVLRLVLNAVAEKGPISFSEYMELALYSDPGGYYRRNVPGRGGDYLTSPTLSPHFGSLVGRQFELMWEEMGKPAEFRVAEVGGGGGELAKAVFHSSSPSLSRIMKWSFVEPLASVEKLQKDALGGLARENQIEWTSGLEKLEPADGVVFANEVLDNMPFDLLEVREGGFDEVRIGLEDQRLVEMLVAIEQGSDLAISGKPALEHLGPGDRVEVRPGVERWFHTAAQTLNRGYVVLIDYGDSEPDIWTSRPAGTLVTYREERLGFDPLEDPGELDITAHVNFSQIGREAAVAGLAAAPLLTQGEWLGDLGLDELQERLKQEQKLAEGVGDHGAALGLLAERSKAAALAHRGGLGDLKVFIAAKGVPIP